MVREWPSPPPFIEQHGAHFLFLSFKGDLHLTLQLEWHVVARPQGGAIGTRTIKQVAMLKIDILLFLLLLVENITIVHVLHRPPY